MTKNEAFKAYQDKQAAFEVALYMRALAAQALDAAQLELDKAFEAESEAFDAWRKAK